MPKGDVTLTREEADALYNWADRCRVYMTHTPERLNEGELIIALLARKLAAAEAEGKVCHTCSGRGSVTNPMADPPDCPTCSGTGEGKP